jgi:hypothetical protein
MDAAHLVSFGTAIPGLGTLIVQGEFDPRPLEAGLAQARQSAAATGQAIEQSSLGWS